MRNSSPSQEISDVILTRPQEHFSSWQKIKRERDVAREQVSKLSLRVQKLREENSQLQAAMQEFADKLRLASSGGADADEEL